MDILWEEPVFSDNSDGLLLVNRSHDFGPFPFGATDVTYIAIDEAGNNATCVIIITVQGMYFLKYSFGQKKDCFISLRQYFVYLIGS